MGDAGEAERANGEGGRNAPRAATETSPLGTVRLDTSVHRVRDFVCKRSERIHKFFEVDCPRLLGRNYCRVFIWPDPADATHIWGFYTLSPGLIEKDSVTRQHEKRIMPGLPIPMIRIGFLGRDDCVSKELKLGDVLLHDAALRVHLCKDITGWGLYLDPENDGLVKWYAGRGFKPTVMKAPAGDTRETATTARPAAMYAPLKALLPEIAGLP
jgi:hypothetical protein